MNQMAADVHMLTAPLRVLAGMIAMTLVIFSFPLICFGLLVYVSSLNPDEIWLLRIAMLLFGPIAAAFWFGMTVRVYQRIDFVRENGFSDKLRFGVATWYMFMGMVCSYAAVGYVSFTDGCSVPTWYFAKVVVAAFSPTLIYLVYRAFKPKATTCIA